MRMWYTKGMQVERYEVSPRLTFILTDTKIIVCTPMQSSLIVYQNPSYKFQWNTLREMIRSGEMTSVADLIHFNKARIGGISQIQGLILVNTELSRHVRPFDTVVC